MYDQTAYNRRYYAKTTGKANSHKKWSQEEIDLILKREYCDRELSDILQRSMMAIAVKRSVVLRQMYDDIVTENENYNRWLAKQCFPDEADFKIPDDN